ncbi:MAG: DUF1819 family protein [Lachnospiraceae bacterium]|nr:DUF1819 family protein [Lachnospiraceae bacterium]
MASKKLATQKGNSPYSAVITREQFLFYETRTTAKLLMEGLPRDEVVERIVSDNLFQYPTEKSVRRMALACLRRLDALEDDSLVTAIANRPQYTAKQICLYAMMKQYRLIWDFMITVMEASDSFDMISGTNGLLGAADGAIILQKKKRVENTAKMMIVGRDQEDQELSLEFDREHCFWKLTKAEKELLKRTPDPIVITIAGFMKDRREWTGSATDLLELLPDLQIKPQFLTRKLNVNVSVLYNDFGISYTPNSRSREKRTFTLKKLNTDEEAAASGDAISVTLSGI